MLGMLTITRKFKVDLGHRIWNQELPENMIPVCKQLHGHTSYIEVEIGGKFDKEKGMLIDFNILKTIEQKLKALLDHRFLLHIKDPLFEELKNLPGVLQIDFVPTAENMALFIYNFYSKNLPKDHLVKRVRYYETENAYAEFNVYPDNNDLKGNSDQNKET